MQLPSLAEKRGVSQDLGWLRCVCVLTNRLQSQLLWEQGTDKQTKGERGRLFREELNPLASLLSRKPNSFLYYLV